MNGNNIIVLSGGQAIAGTKSNEIQADCGLIEISSPTSGKWREFITGRKEWTLNVNFLLLADTDVQNLLQVGNAFTLLVKGRNADDSYGVTGDAILKTVKHSYTRGNLCVGTYQFRGNGALTIPPSSGGDSLE